MPESYNPIVRMFGRYRAALCASVGLPRHRVTPSTRLDALIPPNRRRSAWAALRATELRVPGLELSLTALAISALLVIMALSSICLWAGRWWAPALAVVPVWYAAYRASRPWAVHFPLCTVGELVVYGTRFSDHTASGHRWSHGDVSLKVRMVMAEALNMRMEDVRPDASLADLGAE